MRPGRSVGRRALAYIQMHVHAHVYATSKAHAYAYGMPVGARARCFASRFACVGARVLHGICVIYVGASKAARVGSAEPRKEAGSGGSSAVSSDSVTDASSAAWIEVRVEG